MLCLATAIHNFKSVKITSRTHAVGFLCETYREISPSYTLSSLILPLRY